MLLRRVIVIFEIHALGDKIYLKNLLVKGFKYKSCRPIIIIIIIIISKLKSSKAFCCSTYKFSKLTMERESCPITRG